MARHKLTDSKIKSISKPGVHGDGDGLYLRVQSSGSRSWIFVWRRYGIRREIGLGPYGAGAGHVSLAAARTKAQECRQIIGAGGDPKTELSERKAAVKLASFGQIADEYIAAMQPKWKSDKTLAKWERFAKIHTKDIRKVPVEAVSTEDVLKVIRPMWADKPETAGNIRECVKLVLDHAKARGLRSGDNPAEWKGHLDQILPPPKKLVRGHHAAMPFSEVASFFKKLGAVGGVGARALEFTILTAARSGEARGATWAEIDLMAKVWTIPAARMKAGREHRVPLSARAVAILEDMRTRQINDLVFPGTKGNAPLSDMTLSKALKAAEGGKYTVHGFRSAFRDWVAESTSFQREVAEAALAHAVGDSVERAYRRGDALEKRRKLMDTWAAYVVGAPDGVVRLERAS
ncbi:site-specific integrase [Rhizobium sp. FKL33]|uniref:tyrosine-type recombinase/integrase n=1 Tax=Rhizobium sp. FKL33 TaxID=2562307 RepID=UPI0010C13EBB|nr:site-specific integrase [Rhizobium sp. FKL33]